MNAIRSSRQKQISLETEYRGGSTSYAAFVQQHLHLKTVIKESHCSPVHTLVFNHTSSLLHNLVASVGSDHATIYDDSHMGDYVALSVQFQNTATAHHPGGGLSTCSWINTEGLCSHPHGDAWLAVAGADPVIQILSVAEARVIAQLKGHTCEVVQLSGALDLPGLLLSLDKEGCIRLWDVRTGACLGSARSDAGSLDLHPSGRCFVTGHRNGRLRLWPLPLVITPDSSPQGAGLAHESNASQHTCVATSAHKEPVGCDPATQPDVGSATSGGSGSATGPQWEASTAGPTVSPRGSSAGGTGARGGGPAAALRCHWTMPAGWELQAGSWLQPPSPLTDTVDSIRILPGGRLVAKAADGRIHVWDVDVTCHNGAAPSMLLRWGVRVPGAGRTSTRGRITFTTTPNGACLAVGTTAGEVHLYDVETGVRSATLAGLRAGSHVRCCALSCDSRHLLAASGNGFIFRFEYVRPEETGQPEGGSSDSQAVCGPSGLQAASIGPCPWELQATSPSALQRSGTSPSGQLAGQPAAPVAPAVDCTEGAAEGTGCEDMCGGTATATPATTATAPSEPRPYMMEDQSMRMRPAVDLPAGLSEVERQACRQVASGVAAGGQLGVEVGGGQGLKQPSPQPTPVCASSCIMTDAWASRELVAESAPLGEALPVCARSGYLPGSYLGCGSAGAPERAGRVAGGAFEAPGPGAGSAAASLGNAALKDRLLNTEEGL